MTLLDRDKTNVLLLAISQALFMTSQVVGIAFGGLVGAMLAEDKAFATMPILATVIGGAVATIPASYLMKRIGRRNGFLWGAIAGIVSGVVGVIAIYAGSLPLFCFAHFLQGVYRATGQYYRFAATDSSPPAFHGRAIAYVLAGGVVAGVAGPQLGIFTKDLLDPFTFAGAYAAVAALGLLAMIPIALLDIPKPTTAETSGPTRPLSVILAQPACLAAIIAGGVSFSVMTLVMTATPLSMVACSFPVETAAIVIQWHVLAMFVPSFFTGWLMAKLGVYRVMYLGLALFAGSIAAAVEGIELANFVIGLVLLGVAWNFLYVGGSTLLTKTYTPAERTKVQAVNEFAMSVGSALSSFSAGGLLAVYDWNAVNLSAIPVLVLTLAAILWSAWSARHKPLPAL
jgi:MFS family permease